MKFPIIFEHNLGSKTPNSKICSIFEIFMQNDRFQRVFPMNNVKSFSSVTMVRGPGRQKYVGFGVHA